MGAVVSTDEDALSGHSRHRFRAPVRKGTGRYVPDGRRRCPSPELFDSSGDEDGVSDDGAKMPVDLPVPAPPPPAAAPTTTTSRKRTIVPIGDKEIVQQYLSGLCYPPDAIPGFLKMARSIVVGDTSPASISTMLPLIPQNVQTSHNPYKLAVFLHSKLQRDSISTELFDKTVKRSTAYTYMEGIVVGVAGHGRAAEPHHAAWVYDVTGRAVLDPMSISGCHGSYPTTGPLRYIGVSVVYTNVLGQAAPGSREMARAMIGRRRGGHMPPADVDADDVGGYQVPTKGLIRSGLIVLD